MGSINAAFSRVYKLNRVKRLSFVSCVRVGTVGSIVQRLTICSILLPAKTLEQSAVGALIINHNPPLLSRSAGLLSSLDAAYLTYLRVLKYCLKSLVLKTMIICHSFTLQELSKVSLLEAGLTTGKWPPMIAPIQHRTHHPAPSLLRTLPALVCSTLH